MKYKIENTISGLVLGTYEASSEEDALDLLARDAGYTSYEEVQEAAPARLGEIRVVELGDDEKLPIEAGLTLPGEKKVLTWLDQVAKPDVRRTIILLDIEERIWESYPEVPPYELGAQYTRTGHPELIHLVEGEDYIVEVIE